MSSLAYSQSKRVENVRVTRERDRQRGRELATLLAATVPVACALLVYAALHIETVRVGYQREARVKAATALQEENRRLRAELAGGAAVPWVSSVRPRFSSPRVFCSRIG